MKMETILNPYDQQTILQRNEKSELLDTFSTIVELREKGFKAEKHPFFGKMTKEEWARITFKHLDHHLRQFNC